MQHREDYIVKVDKPLTQEVLTEMRKGVWLKDLELMTRECEITQIGDKFIICQDSNSFTVPDRLPAHNDIILIRYLHTG